MSRIGLLTLVLSGTAVGAPPVSSAPPPAPPTRWEEPAGQYPASAGIVRPVSLPTEVPGRGRPVETVTRRVNSESADVAGRASPVATAIASPPTVGLVHEPAYAIDPDLCRAPAGYVPQVGDIVLFVSDHIVWKALFALALSHEPYHAAIVVRMCDGCPGLLEAGPPDVVPVVRTSPLAERLATDTGRVYVRRRCSPLTTDQADALNGFAARQEGKPYAYIRFLCQGTPFRSRGPLRTHFIGKSRGEPFSYFCSELVMESLVSAGLTDPESARPRATTPGDLFYDESNNPWINKHLKLYPCWGPPQRWVADGCAVAK